MPLYTFKDTETGDEFDLQLKLAEREVFLEANPNLKQIITSAPKIVSGVQGQHKTDGGFNELMSRIGEANPHTPLGRSVNTHDSGQVAVNQAVDRYKKRAGIETSD
jgi:predicted nucleic acid-binding Zn ribbon protein